MGWPEDSPEDEQFCAYVNWKCKLSVDDGCLLWGSRVIVPENGRKQAHPGISRMNSLARCCVWWPGIDKDLELRVKSFEACQKAPPKVPLHLWSWPRKP